MLKKLYRFHGLGSLRYVYSHGRTVRDEMVSLKFVTRPNSKHYRCAVVVSRKTSSSAVVRNHIRRRIFEIVRNLQPELKEFDLLFTVHSDKVRSISHKKLVNQITDLLDQARVIIKPKEN